MVKGRISSDSIIFLSVFVLEAAGGVVGFPSSCVKTWLLYHFFVKKGMAIDYMQNLQVVLVVDLC